MLILLNLEISIEPLDRETDRISYFAFYASPHFYGSINLNTFPSNMIYNYMIYNMYNVTAVADSTNKPKAFKRV